MERLASTRLPRAAALEVIATAAATATATAMEVNKRGVPAVRPAGRRGRLASEWQLLGHCCGQCGLSKRSTQLMRRSIDDCLSDRNSSAAF
ncbi:hypothetical protein J6590_043565 [Homalodisca vitripennis]|nr:hypothetical protein J6590_043565 [Homalodisca vitripennis]